MKTLRYSVSLLCVLALLLSLAPCAFAEGTEEAAEPPITITGTQIGKEKDGGRVYEAAGDVKVDRDGEIKVYGQETITTDGKTVNSEVNIEGSLTNLGQVQASSNYAEGNTGDSSNALVQAGSIVNADLLRVESSGGQNNTSELKTTSGILSNDVNGFICVSSGDPNGSDQNAEAIITVEGDLRNDGKITVSAEGTETSSAAIKATGDITNFGFIELLAKDASITSTGGTVKNYDTIYMTTDGRPHTYYGVNYVDDINGREMIIDTALDDWKKGGDGEVVLTLKNGEELFSTKAGQTLVGWALNEKIFTPGETYTIEVFDVVNLKAIWEYIKNGTPIPTGDSGYTTKTENSGEKIVKYLDGVKVLDADRREMEMDTEYFRVAKTSYNRLIVVFTWQQMAEMEAGEYLFYIVQPNGTETEYTLTIW